MKKNVFKLIGCFCVIVLSMFCMLATWACSQKEREIEKREKASPTSDRKATGHSR